MSFSAAVKQELAALPLEKTCCMTAELNALTACSASLALLGGGRTQIQYETLSASVLKRIFLLLRQRYQLQGQPRVSRIDRFGGMRQYRLRLSPENSRALMHALNPDRAPDHMPSLPRRVMRRICCRRAWIRGAFLACGSVQHPQKGIRAEFVLTDAPRAAFLHRLLEQAGVAALRTLRRGSEVVYVRQGDALANLLGMMGASRAMLELENIRAAGNLHQAVTRATNCDHANLQKQLTAAQRQVEAITRISLAKGLTSLPKDLEALARLRLRHPDASLEGLGALCVPPLGKSGVQHRMRRILNIAEALEAPETIE